MIKKEEFNEELIGKVKTVSVIFVIAFLVSLAFLEPKQRIVQVMALGLMHFLSATLWSKGELSRHVTGCVAYFSAFAFSLSLQGFVAKIFNDVDAILFLTPVVVLACVLINLWLVIQVGIMLSRDSHSAVPYEILEDLDPIYSLEAKAVIITFAAAGIHFFFFHFHA